MTMNVILEVENVQRSIHKQANLSTVEDLLSLYSPICNFLSNCLTYFVFIAIDQGSINVSVSYLNGPFDSCQGGSFGSLSINGSSLSTQPSRKHHGVKLSDNITILQFEDSNRYPVQSKVCCFHHSEELNVFWVSVPYLTKGFDEHCI